MELNHIKPRHKGGSDLESNLEALTPTEHAAKDPYRRLKRNYSAKISDFIYGLKW